MTNLLASLPTGVAWRSEVDVINGVCLFVCLFVRTITSERLNVGRSNLAVRYVVQKSRPTSKVNVKGQRSRSQGTKKRKTAESSSFMVALCNRADHIYFHHVSFFLLLLLSSFFPRLISAVGDWMSTILRHMVWS